VTTQSLQPVAAPDGLTERFDPIACLDQRTREGAASAQPLGPGRYLKLDGPDSSLLIPLEDEAIRVGRGLAADLHLDEMSVSRRHAILLPTSACVRILDDRSSNGTFVNGRRVQQADLRDGDVITIGRVTLRYLES